MKSPRFSIIIPTLNEEKYLPHLLDSLCEQTEKDFEVIVVDGSSKDKTITVAQGYKNRLPALEIVVSKKASLPLQRNIGAKHTHGTWYIFVDADSIFLPYFIERIRVFIRQQKPTLFTTWFRPDSEVSGDAVLTLLANLSTESSMIFKRAHAPGPLAIVTRDAFRAVGGYDESLKSLEDYDFSRRVCERGHQMHILRETLCVWSLRRWRQQGTLKVAQTYAKVIFSVLLTKRTPQHMPGYIMGGHLYNKRRSIKRSVIKEFEKKLKNIVGELFE